MCAQSPQKVVTGCILKESQGLLLGACREAWGWAEKDDGGKNVVRSPEKSIETNRGYYSIWGVAYRLKRD